MLTVYQQKNRSSMLQTLRRFRTAARTSISHRCRSPGLKLSSCCNLFPAFLEDNIAILKQL